MELAIFIFVRGLGLQQQSEAVRARDAAIFDIKHIKYTKQLQRTAYTQPGPFLRQPSHYFGQPSQQERSTRRNASTVSRRRAAAMGKPPLTTRRRYHIALGAARQLFAGGDISASGCGALKNHIFDDDGRVAAAVEIFWLNDDGDALLATLRALGGPSWTPETERRINDHYAAYQESVRAHNEAYRHRPEVWAAATYEATGG